MEDDLKILEDLLFKLERHYFVDIEVIETINETYSKAINNILKNRGQLINCSINRKEEKICQ